jgi:hypothetical protein
MLWQQDSTGSITCTTSLRPVSAVPEGEALLVDRGSVKLGRAGVRKAPKGPALSSRRFQPAESRAERMTTTPTGLTCSSAPSGPVQVFRLLPVGFTHGYSRHAPSGQFPPHHLALPELRSFLTLHSRDFDATLLAGLVGVDRRRSCAILSSARVARGSRAFRLESWLPVCRVTSAGSSEASNSPS